MTDTTSRLREQLLELSRQHESGALDKTRYESRKAALERKLLDAVLATPGASAQAASPDHATPAAAVARPSGLVWVGVAVVVVAVAAVGYGLTGAPGEIGKAPAGFAAGDGNTAGGEAAPHALGRAQMEEMVAKLAERMKNRPDDAEGWAILGRSYMALGRAADAVGAYEHALKLVPDDASMLADYADALAVKNNSTLDGEPTRIIERALKIEPDNIKALALAGTAAFNNGDFAGAVKHWDRAVRVGPSDNPLVEMSRNGAAEARERGKLGPAPASPATATAKPGAAEAAAPAAAAAGPSVSGTVRLSAALKSQAAPDDTVFIFARPAEGSRMPLAIARLQVKDLPADFKLDDSQALSPATKLSSAKRVQIGARVSKSGQATPQPGDLEGTSAPVDVGASGVSVEISTKVP